MKFLLTIPGRILWEGSFNLPLFYDEIEQIPNVPAGNDLSDIGFIWKGFISIQLSGTYTFYAITDDGCRLWLNNTNIIDQWQNQAATEQRGSIFLNSGLIPFEFHYYEDGGDEQIEVYWSGPGFSRVLISPSVFRHGKS